MGLVATDGHICYFYLTRVRPSNSVIVILAEIQHMNSLLFDLLTRHIRLQNHKAVGPGPLNFEQVDNLAFHPHLEQKECLANLALQFVPEVAGDAVFWKHEFLAIEPNFDTLQMNELNSSFALAGRHKRILSRALLLKTNAAWSSFLLYFWLLRLLLYLEIRVRMQVRRFRYDQLAVPNTLFE